MDAEDDSFFLKGVDECMTRMFALTCVTGQSNFAVFKRVPSIEASETHSMFFHKSLPFFYWTEAKPFTFT